MFRNALAAALRHLYRGKLFTVIAVCGLAVGLCAALLAALYIRSQYSYNHFVPGYRDVYQATMNGTVPGRPTHYSAYTPVRLAALMPQRFPEIASVTRVAGERILLRRGDIVDSPPVSSVDPGFFDTVPLRSLAGDPAATLAQPDRLVITRAVARKFFGEVSPLGQTLEAVPTNGSAQTLTLIVGAVIDDIPEGRTQLFARVFVSGRSAWTSLAVNDRTAAQMPGLVFANGMSSGIVTLVRLRPGGSPLPLRGNLSGLLPEIAGGKAPAQFDDGEKSALDLLRIDRINTDPSYGPAGFVSRMVMVAALALVILIIAAVNFVNLLTARSGARALEVGVRKLAGASRTTLACQFIGEASVYVAIAVVVAVAMTELLLPHVNAFLDANADFHYWREPALLGWILLGTAAFGLLAGFWPALVLSALQPLGAMHGARLARGDGSLFRQLLVSVQFAMLAGLMLAAGVVYLQRQYATGQALHASAGFDTDQLLILEMRCTPARMVELRKLASVRDVGCSSSVLLGGEGTENGSWLTGRTRDGRSIPLMPVNIDDRMLALYGIKLLAGRTLTADEFGTGFMGRHSTRFLINETAMRALGFESPAAALGPYPLTEDTARLSNGRPAGNGLDEIVGVVPDFSMAGVATRIGAAVFYADPMQFSTISVKLKGTDIPATLAAIDRLWESTGGMNNSYSRDLGHLTRYFYDERVERMYQYMLREARAFSIAALVAISLALLGLLGLAASVAERRTKEIGIRKALGATTGDVLRLLLWQFSKPVVWANLITWPLAGWAMQRWLNGFAYHIDLPLWLFPATTLVTVLIALATVSAHAMGVARAKPVTALRYE